MVQENQNFEMHEGTRKVLRVVCTNQDDNTSLDDLDGLTLRLTFAKLGRNGPLRTNPVLELDNDGEAAQFAYENEDGTKDAVLITLLPTDTANFAQGGETTYHWQLEAFTSDEDVDAVMLSTGTVTIKPNVQEVTT